MMTNKDKKGPDMEKQDMQFPAFLASIAHDMKNSLGMLINTTEEILGNCSGKNCPSHPLLSNLQYEAKRVNNNLIQLLTLYKMDKDRYTLTIEYHSVSEFLEDAALQNKPLLECKGISIEADCPEELAWFFDRDLVAGVINNVMNNAYRYADSRIWITAREENGYLAIHIRDNGEGYPEHMITEGAAGSSRVSFSSGSTGLGLYFASIVATMHRNKNRKGFIRTANCETSGGGCFSIYLP
ncbi:MAG: HAMP domain-containing histidine kinase [Nitrospirae bacterium]|nr:HAMP domain-containing histidine kinase [Nitrospirota bacterium]